MRKIFVVEHSAWCQMKENYQIYLPYQFHWRPQSVGGDAQLSHKKMKTLFLTNMSKSRRLTSTFFPMIENKQNIAPSLISRFAFLCFFFKLHHQLCIYLLSVASESKKKGLIKIS